MFCWTILFASWMLLQSCFIGTFCEVGFLHLQLESFDRIISESFIDHFTLNGSWTESGVIFFGCWIPLTTDSAAKFTVKCCSKCRRKSQGKRIQASSVLRMLWSYFSMRKNFSLWFCTVTSRHCAPFAFALPPKGGEQICSPDWLSCTVSALISS